MNPSVHDSQYTLPSDPKSDTLNILYFNARSVLPKISELQLLTKLHRPSIICIVETWLSQDIPSDDLDIEGYQVVRLDRNRHGGGILFYVSNAITYKMLPQCVGLELLSIAITGNNCKACVTLFYRPPSSSIAIFDTLFSYLESIDISQFSNFIMLGDFS